MFWNFNILIFCNFLYLITCNILNHVFNNEYFLSRAPVDSSFQLTKLIGLPSENIGVLKCIVLYCIVLYCIVLYCIVTGFFRI